MAVSPPRPSLPPLNALRAFEAAARTGSFQAAATELNVTLGAVSQQIRTLEDWAGLRVFHRGGGRGARLNEDGARVVADLSEAFDILGGVAARLRATDTARPLHLATLPALAQLWLPARLSGLRASLGDRHISVTAVEEPPNLLREHYDFSIFIAPGHRGRVLSDDQIVPVCAPEIAEKLQRPEDLPTQTLLHDATWDGDWAAWAKALDVALPNASNGPRFSLYALVLDEAKAGAGIAMGHLSLVQSALDAGTLVRPLRDATAFATRPTREAAVSGRALSIEFGPHIGAAQAQAVEDVLRAAPAAQAVFTGPRASR